MICDEAHMNARLGMARVENMLTGNDRAKSEEQLGEGVRGQPRCANLEPVAAFWLQMRLTRAHPVHPLP